MKSIAIVTDSNCGMSPAQGKRPWHLHASNAVFYR